MHFSNVHTHFQLDIAKKFEFRIDGILHNLLLRGLYNELGKIDVFHATDG
jgi:hypothetical protein